MPASKGRRPRKPLGPVPTDNPKPVGDTVYVGCKLPNGLVLQNFVMEQVREAVPGGFRDTPMARRLPEAYRLNGTSLTVDQRQNGDVGYPIVHHAAITAGVPREFWEKWREANSRSELVCNNIIFAHKEEASVRRMAANFAAQKTGLEPLDPDPEAIQRVIRAPKGMRIELLNERN